MIDAAVCPYCRSGVTDTDESIVCEGCDTPHHRDCYEENRGCTVFGCQLAPPEEPKVHVAFSEEPVYAGPIPPILSDFAPVATPAPAVYRPVAAARRPAIRSYSPLGLLTVSGPPAPPLIGAAPVERDSPVVSRKKKTTFVLLGVFLGPLGLHNFYAGYCMKALAQLAITVLTLGYGLPVSWIWAIVDACSVEHDRAGAPFSS
jgi:TM2 domain-containing membrane protein YozV